MALGTTNIGIDDVYTETGGSAGNNSSLKSLYTTSWNEGPSPGDGTYAWWGTGAKAPGYNILYNPYNNFSGTLPSTNNYKLEPVGRNLAAYMGGSSGYVIDFYMQNDLGSIRPPDPQNDVSAYFQLQDRPLTSDVIATASNLIGPGQTYGPVDVSQITTFNVNYFYCSCQVDCNNPGTTYAVQVYLNGSQVYSQGGLTGVHTFDWNNFSPFPTNSGGGFIIEFFFN